jgi:DNA-directed RNA polymerase sigma subunit (sigma70/sigma32)
MDNRERDYQIYVMRMHYYMTLTAIGERMNLSRERVRQIVLKVEKNLKDYKDVQNIRAAGNRKNNNTAKHGGQST